MYDGKATLKEEGYEENDLFQLMALYKKTRKLGLPKDQTFFVLKHLDIELFILSTNKKLDSKGHSAF